MTFQAGTAPARVVKFRPGTSGNPRGPIKSLTLARRALARELGDNAAALVATTMRLALAGNAECAAALVIILASGFEAPPSTKNAAAGLGTSSTTPPIVAGGAA
ncbi:hypothetical protein [Paraburkholderia sp. Cpub6]|uniref:hypothetical protein n=1 Tax=Paraburkholderia sp. Cpub6 TaxID=2723094 RepID=UPI00160894D0|nr:hypothetical protein [Paraburkholderia sp. Cpub6]MBB5463879.1 hypothetical protein [Paraburkholderia sp. Cpub6]